MSKTQQGLSSPRPATGPFPPACCRAARSHSTDHGFWNHFQLHCEPHCPLLPALEKNGNEELLISGPFFILFFFPFRWCMYNAYLFGGKTAGCRRSILVDILTYSEKGKFSHANRYLGFFFLIYWIYRRKFNSPLATQVSSCTLDSWAIFPRASLFRFLPSSVSSLMVSWVSELLPFWWCMGLFAPALC